MRIFRMLLLIIPALAFAGYAPSQTNGKGENPTPLASITPPANESVPNPLPILPTQGGYTPVSPATIPSDPQLQSLIDKAIADLAQRLKIQEGEIKLVEATAVVWPDSSLGCPQPGMAYKQVPQDGLLIRLQAEDQIYPYHSGGRHDPFLCERTVKESKSLPQIDIRSLTLPESDLTIPDNSIPPDEDE